MNICLRLSQAALLNLTIGSAMAAVCDDQVVSQVILDKQAQRSAMPAAHARILNLQIGVDDLESVQDTLGKASSLPRKEHAAVRLCYTGTQPAAPVIIFEASALGGWKRLTAFCVVTGQEAAMIRSACTQTASVAPGLVTDGGLQAGQTIAAARMALGKPTVSKRGKNSYWYVSHTQKENDVTEYIGIASSKGNVTGFKISRVESN